MEPPSNRPLPRPQPPRPKNNVRATRSLMTKNPRHEPRCTRLGQAKTPIRPFVAKNPRHEATPPGGHRANRAEKRLHGEESSPRTAIAQRGQRNRGKKHLHGEQSSPRTERGPGHRERNDAAALHRTQTLTPKGPDPIKTPQNPSQPPSPHTNTHTQRPTPPRATPPRPAAPSRPGARFAIRHTVMSRARMRIDWET